MRFLKLRISIGESYADEVQVPLFGDDATYEELDEIALEVFNDLVRFDWEVADG